MSPDESIDARIDDLYRAPLSEFTSARNAVVKSLRGADASRVRKLAKPTVAAWAVNQVYWHARPIYKKLIDTGERLRDAQIAALKGKSADVRAATDAHRRAIGDAVQEAQRLAAASGSHPIPDELMRTFEALSLAPERAGDPGRLTRALQPAGFEALAGVSPAKAGRYESTAGPAKAGRHESTAGPAKAGRHESSPAEAGRHRAAAQHERDRKLEAAAAKKRVAEERKRRAAVAKAEAALQRARAAETLAREQLTRAERDVRAAEERLARIKSAS